MALHNLKESRRNAPNCEFVPRYVGDDSIFARSAAATAALERPEVGAALLWAIRGLADAVL